MKLARRIMTAAVGPITLALAFVAAGCFPTAAQTETVLYDFQGGADGSQPAAGLVADKAGNLYGTTTTVGMYGFGTVFELSPPANPGGAWTQTTLYSFQGFLAGDDGATPEGPVTLDEEGNLYGTTYGGGDSTYDCYFFNSYCGTVFKLTRPRQPGGVWQESVIHRFNGLDGWGPYAGVTLGQGGKLYGTTTSGGITGAAGWGTVYELSPPSDEHPGAGWTATVIYNFAGAPDAGLSIGDVVFGRTGNLYGSTFRGGAQDSGAVFELVHPSTPGGAWTENVLYSFTGGNDGSYPYSGVVIDGHGNLDGTAVDGGAYLAGAVFQVTPPAAGGGAWTENTLWSFTFYGPDGGLPYAKPILDKKGNLFGTAFWGNGGPLEVCAPDCGTVYELTPPAKGTSSWTETTLYSFVGVNGSVFDGAEPTGSLLLGKHGELYGTTMTGGDYLGDGAVFEIVP